MQFMNHTCTTSFLGKSFLDKFFPQEKKRLISRLAGIQKPLESDPSNNHLLNLESCLSAYLNETLNQEDLY